jgi:multiple antibiotic resistance protein
MDFNFTKNIIIDISLNWGIIFRTRLSLITILNPLTTIPYYYLLHPNRESPVIKKDRQKISLSVFIILWLAFAIWGLLLDFFNLKIPYFKMGWGVVLFIMALSMIKWEMNTVKMNRIERSKIKNDYIEKWLIIPLALPLTAGPWSIAYVISVHWIWLLNWVIAIFFSTLVVLFTLMYSYNIKRLLWDIWMHIITRVFWLFMLWVALQIIIENLLFVVKI